MDFVRPVLRVRTIPSGYSTRVILSLKVNGGLHNITSNHAPYFTLTTETCRKGHPNQCQGGGGDHETILKYYPELADLAALHLSDIDGQPMHAEANGWYSLAGALTGHAGEWYHAGNSISHYPKPEGAPRRDEWDTTDYREPTSDECLQRFADHARVTLEEAQRVRAEVEAVWLKTRAACELDGWMSRHDKYTPTEQLKAKWEINAGTLAWTKDSWVDARAWFARWMDEQKPRWKAEAEACIVRHGLVVFGDPWPAPKGE